MPPVGRQNGTVGTIPRGWALAPARIY